MADCEVRIRAAGAIAESLLKTIMEKAAELGLDPNQTGMTDVLYGMALAIASMAAELGMSFDGVRRVFNEMLDNVFSSEPFKSVAARRAEVT